MEKMAPNEKYAKELVEALLKEDICLLDMLSVEHTNDISDLVRSIIGNLNSEEQLKISQLLSKILLASYDENMISDDIRSRIKQMDTNTIFLIKENVIYYIGRLENANSKEVIRKCYQIETNNLNKMNLAFSACLLGDQEIELDFISKIKPGNEYDLLMRSWTMAFFKNADNPYEYVDCGDDDWSVAKKPRITRLQINEENEKGYKKAMAFRLFDLTVLYLFCKSRSFEDLTNDEYEIIKKCTSSSSLIVEEKKKEIEDTKVKILTRK